MLKATDQNDRTWGTLIHLSPLLGYVVPVPGATILAPLLLWLEKRKESAFLDDQGKEALNFNLTFAAAAFVSLLLMGGYVVAAVFSNRSNTPFSFGALFILLALLILALTFGHLILMIVAAVKANNGAAYRYPLTIRFVR